MASLHSGRITFVQDREEKISWESTSQVRLIIIRFSIRAKLMLVLPRELLILPSFCFGTCAPSAFLNCLLRLGLLHVAVLDNQPALSQSHPLSSVNFWQLSSTLGNLSCQTSSIAQRMELLDRLGAQEQLQSSKDPAHGQRHVDKELLLHELWVRHGKGLDCCL